MWTVIQYVTGGFALMAFLGAVVASVRLRSIRRDEVALSKAVPADVPQVLDRIAGRFHVDTTSLTREQKAALVRDQLQLQAEKFRLTLRAGLLALIVLAALTAFAVFVANREDPNAVPAPQVSQATANPTIPLSPRTFNMTASLEATTKAHISEGGSAELHLFVNESLCNKPQKVYKNWSSGPIFTLTATCLVPVLANTRYEFRAEQLNHNADAHDTVLRVSYARQ
ncbi:hypothetical protein [Roseateles sp. P5_E1]